MSPAPFRKLSSQAAAFLQSVLRLQPRLAVFDCDGTLWDGDAGEQFFYWELERGVVGPEVLRWAGPRYDQYRAGQVGEEQMCGEMVAMHQGIPAARLERAAQEFFSERIARHIFPEMQELTRRLAATGCELWAVSSTNEWVIRAALEHFAISQERVLAASVETVAGMATDRLIRVPTDESKVAAIRQVIGRTPDAAFGNSIHDQAMLEISAHAFAVNPSAELEQAAQQRGWTIYRPDKAATD
jgi:phosphoserine phosphatase